MDKKKELVKNSAIIFLGKVSTRFIVFLLLPLYTALLNTEEYGLADLITTYVTLLVPVISLEMDNGTFRFLIEHEDDKQMQGHILYNAVLFYAKILTAYTVGYIIFDHIWPVPYSLYVYLRIAIGIICALFLQTARGLHDNIGYSISSFISGVLTVIANIVLIKYMHWGADGVLLGNIIGIAACTVYLIFRLDIFRIVRGKNDPALQKEILKFSIPLVANTVCWWIINAADRTIVSVLMSISANGIYAVSIKFASAVASLFSIFSISWLESASVHINDPDREEFFNDIFRQVMNMFASICILVIAFMPFLFSIFVKEGFAEAYRYIPLSMFGAFMSSCASMYNGIYVALKKTNDIARTALIAGIIDIIVDFALIRYIGIHATAVSTICAYLYMLVYRAFDMRKYHIISARKIYEPKVVLPILVSFALSTAIYYSGSIPMQAAGAFLFTAFCIWLNRNMLRTILSSLKRRFVHD